MLVLKGINFTGHMLHVFQGATKLKRDPWSLCGGGVVLLLVYMFASLTVFQELVVWCTLRVCFATSFRIAGSFYGLPAGSQVFMWLLEGLV